MIREKKNITNHYLPSQHPSFTPSPTLTQQINPQQVNDAPDSSEDATNPNPALHEDIGCKTSVVIWNLNP